MKEKRQGRSTGLEPATFGTTIQRSNQLSYDRHKKSVHEDISVLLFESRVEIALFLNLGIRESYELQWRP